MSTLDDCLKVTSGENSRLHNITIQHRISCEELHKENDANCDHNTSDCAEESLPKSDSISFPVEINSSSLSSDLNHDFTARTNVESIRNDQISETGTTTVVTKDNEAAKISEHFRLKKNFDAEILRTIRKSQENLSQAENLPDVLANSKICQEGVNSSNNCPIQRSENQTEAGEALFDSLKESETSVGTAINQQDPIISKKQLTDDVSDLIRRIEADTEKILQMTLSDVRYEPRCCKEISHSLAGKILAKIIEHCPRRYKLVIFVSIGSLCDKPGIQFGSRCLWDDESDALATVRYANETLFAVAMVYALCTD